MSASVFEQALARAQSALLAATPAADRVDRARDDAYADDELPALNIRRQDTGADAIGNGGERHILAFTLECHVQGGETEADALHMAAHEVLLADPQLATAGHGLRCTSTEIQTAVADFPSARLTARYQIQLFVRPGNLTRAVI